MQEPIKTISAYLDEVAKQIRWKRARTIVTEELRQHLEDQQEAFLTQGVEKAEERAVEEMGDPVSVGIALDGLHRPKPQWGLLLFVMALAVLGGVLRVWLTADWSVSNRIFPDGVVVSLALGCIVLLSAYFLGYSTLARRAGWLYIAVVLLGVAVIFCSPRVQGVAFYGRSFSRVFPAVYAFWLYRCRRKGWLGLFEAILGGVPLAMLCCMVPDIFGLVLLLATGFILLLYGAWRNWFRVGKWQGMLTVIAAGAVGAVSVLVRLLSSDTVYYRLRNLLHPEIDPNAAGYVPLGIREAVKNAKWLGQGTWSESFSPYPYEIRVLGGESDAFITTILYRLGWLPLLLVLLAFTLLLAALLLRLIRQKGELSKSLTLAVLLTFLMEALMSLAWGLGYPLLTVSFPLLVGNLHTVVYLGLFGLVLSSFREESIFRDGEMGSGKHPFPYRITISVEKAE